MYGSCLERLSQKCYSKDDCIQEETEKSPGSEPSVNLLLDKEKAALIERNCPFLESIIRCSAWSFIVGKVLRLEAMMRIVYFRRYARKRWKLPYASKAVKLL